MASVIKEEPSWDSLPASCPPAIARLLRRCLRKRPRERLQDIGDARLEIQDVLAGTAVEARCRRATATRCVCASAGAGRGSAGSGRRRSSLAAGLAALVAQRYFKEAPEPRPAAHVLLDTPEDLTFWIWSPVAVSPDGRHVAFLGTSPAAAGSCGFAPWTHPTPGPFPERWVPSEGFSGPPTALRSCSPSRASFGSSPSRAAPCSGSARAPRVPTTPAHGAPRGRSCSPPGGPAGPARACTRSRAAGGEATPLTALDESRGETNHNWPQFLPDGRHLLFRVASRRSSACRPARDLPRIPRGEATGPARGRPLPVCRAPGHLLFVQGGILLAQRFDPRELVTKGEAVPIASSVAAFAWPPTMAGSRPRAPAAWPGCRGRAATFGSSGSTGREGARDARGAREIRPDRPLPGRQTGRGGDRRRRGPVGPLGDRRRPRRAEPPHDRPRERPRPRLVPGQPGAHLLVERERRPEPAPQGAFGIRAGRALVGRDRPDARGAGHREGLDPRGEHAALPDDRGRADALGPLAGRRGSARAAREGLPDRQARRLSRRPLARLHLAGIGALRGLRRAVPQARREGARLHGRRCAAPVAPRREGALLPVARRQLDGRGRSGGSERARGRLAHDPRSGQGRSRRSCRARTTTTTR